MSESLFELLARGSDPDRGTLCGIVTAVVTSNKDDEGLGRVKVKYPWLSDTDESDWARVVTFMGGKERGAFFLPEVGDEVVVAFEHGDPHVAYVLGSVWNSNQKPFETNSDGKNAKRVIKSKSGHLIRLDDTDDAGKIEIIDSTGKNVIAFDSAKNTISITSDADITLTASKGTIKLSAKTIEIAADGEASVTAKQGAKLQADGQLTVKGATVAIN